MRIIVKEVSSPKKSINGNEYILVKSIKDSVVSIWDDQRAIWHLFTVGADLDVTTSTRGKYTSITGVVGFEPQNVTTGQNGAGNTLYKSPTPNFNDWLVEKIKDIDAKVSWLVEERKTLGLTEVQIIDAKESMRKAMEEVGKEKLPDLNG